MYKLEAVKNALKPKSGNSEMVEVTLLRNVFVEGYQGTAGETIKVERSSVSQLIGCGAIDDPDAEKKAATRAALEATLPAKQKPAPLPNEWKDLPKPMKDWHELRAEFNSLADYEWAIWKLIAPSGKEILLDRSTLDQLPRQQRIAIISKIGMPPGSLNNNDRSAFLNAAFRKASDAISKWREKNADLYFLHTLNAAAELKAFHGRVNRKIKELNQGAFELFQARIAPLGLGRADAERLFRNQSADMVNYQMSKVGLPSQRNIVISGKNDTYLDATLEQVIYYWRVFQSAEALADKKLAELKQARAKIPKAA